MDRRSYYILGFLAIAAIMVGTLYFVNSDFGGADDAGSDAISDMKPGFEPWWDGIFGDYELPGETESLLFALQAAIGAVIIGYVIGRYSRGG